MLAVLFAKNKPKLGEAVMLVLPQEIEPELELEVELELGAEVEADTVPELDSGPWI